jgi:hypothetical protein
MMSGSDICRSEHDSGRRYPKCNWPNHKFVFVCLRIGNRRSSETMPDHVPA